MEDRKAVSLADIAREVGVSAMTVSAVLNGNETNVHVTEGTRARVMEAVQKLRYNPNLAASGLSSKRTNTIGLIAEFAYPGDMNLVFHQLMNGILEGCILYGQRITVYPVSNWEREQSDLLEFCDGSVDGFILIGPDLSESVVSKLFQATPIIAIHNGGELGDATNIDIDNELGAYEATKYLIGLGHSRIAHIAGPPDRSGSDDRFNGYRRALSDSGIKFDQRLVAQGLFTLQSGTTAAGELLGRFERDMYPTAVFCASDSMALGAMTAFTDQGLTVPDDISVAGFDDAQINQRASVKLTTVRQPLSPMGVYAVAMLLQAIDEGTGIITERRTDVEYPNREINERMFVAVNQFGNTALFPPELVIRDSTSARRA
jgi:LacI family transcriptional regulator